MGLCTALQRLILPPAVADHLQELAGTAQEAACTVPCRVAGCRACTSAYRNMWLFLCCMPDHVDLARYIPNASLGTWRLLMQLVCLARHLCLSRMVVSTSCMYV